MLKYFSQYLYNEEKKIQEEEILIDFHTENDIITVEKKFVISLSDIKSVNLQPVTKQLNKKKEQKTNNFEKINMRCLNKAQLDAIMNVKLKHVDNIVENKTYEPRHPVLKELLNKTNKK